MRLASVVVLLCAALPLTAHGVPLVAAARQQPAPANGFLAGQVIDAATGAPVANTLMGLSRRTGAGPNTTPSARDVPLVTVMTDGGGRFVIRDVPKGSYLLLATASGYIVSMYGQRRPQGPTHTLDVGDDAQVTGLTIPLWRHAVIAGTVTDEAGEPAIGVTVRALRRSPNGPGGQLRYAPGPETTTDDRGEYRLTELPPGQFLVSVPETHVTIPSAVVDTFLQSMAGAAGHAASAGLLDLLGSATALPATGAGIRDGDLLLESWSDGRATVTPPPGPAGPLVYPTAYYAGDGAPQAAITLGPGEERAGVDLHLVLARGVRVTGVVTSGGTPTPNVPVRLMSAGGQVLQRDAGYEAAATVSAADGTFTLLGVPPGRYVLKAVRTARVALPPSLAANPAAVAAYVQGAESNAALDGAEQPLAIGDAGLDGVAVVLTPGATVHGAVTFADDPKPPADQVHAMGVLLGSEDGGLAGVGVQISPVAADGTFAATAPTPGRYSVSPLAPPRGWVMSAITLAGRPLDGPLDLSGGDVTGFAITYTNKTAQLVGTARTSAGAASATADVVVFPVERTGWVQDPLNLRAPRINQVSTGGAFDVGGLLPGEYLVAAVDDADVPEMADPAFFEALVSLARHVTLGAGETRSQDLVVGRIK